MRASLSSESFVSPSAHPHTVQFYETDEFLSGVVSKFIREGLNAGEPAVVIATPVHRASFCVRLIADGCDIEQVRSSGMLTLLDATETLSTFMREDSPNEGLFKKSVGGIVSAC